MHYKSDDGTVISALLWVPFNLKRDGRRRAWCCRMAGPTARPPTISTARPSRWRSAAMWSSRPTSAARPATARRSSDATSRISAAAIWRTKSQATNSWWPPAYVIAKKLGITGGSYGGYMTLMAIGKTPDLWAAAVEQYGIIDWRTMLSTRTRRCRQYEVGAARRSREGRHVYAATRPITYIRAAKAPLLVLQGDNDIRVSPKEQAEKVVAILKGEGRTVDAHYYPGEGHGFAKRENQIDALERTVAWFEKYLK